MVRRPSARQALPAAVLWSLAAHLTFFFWGMRSTPRLEAASAPPAHTRTVEFTASVGTPSAPVGRAAAGPLLPPTERGPEAPTIPGPADAWHREMASPW